jgi:flavin reductase (DIM6/NTAB) family NADH-FMN oxidoreductase RutF
MRRHAAGVVIVTALGDDGPAGCTVTSFTAASLHPPLVSFYANRGSRTAALVRGSGAFAVNVMACGQYPLAHAFASNGIDRFGVADWHVADPGVPYLTGAVAQLGCTLDTVVRVGDHDLVVGLVVHAATGSGVPLVYHEARYGAVFPVESPDRLSART